MPDDSTLAPKYAIKVGGIDVQPNFSQFITSVEYESADGLADIGRIRCIDPDHLVSSSKAFQPGNEISFFFGYKEPLPHVGRIKIVRQVPDFPEEGLPTLEVMGYTREWEMMDNSPEGDKKAKGVVTTPSQKKKKKRAKKEIRTFPDQKYSDVVRAFARRYDMEADVDNTPEPPSDRWQPANMSDYEYIQGVANVTGFYLWVDGVPNGNSAKGKWTLHLRDPNKLNDQDKKYTFEYNNGDMSTLLSFQPELLIKGARTKITVVVKDRKTGKELRAELEEENDRSPDVEAFGDPMGTVDGEYTSGSEIKLYFGDFAFNVISNRRYKNEWEAINWARQWFRRLRENFILSSGKVIGTEDLMARQVHTCKGITPSYVGDYYFSRVKHMLNESGYFCDFNCRREIPA
jgi:phage protein D